MIIYLERTSIAAASRLSYYTEPKKTGRVILFLLPLVPEGTAKVRKFCERSKYKIYFVSKPSFHHWRPSSGHRPSLAEWCKGRNFYNTLQEQILYLHSNIP